MPTTEYFLIADNQDITACGVRHLIAHAFASPVTVSVHSRGELVTALMEHEEATIVLDYTLFDFHGVGDFLVLQKRFVRARWMFFSSELTDDIIGRLAAEDNISMILKDCSSQEISTALAMAAQSGRFICHQITEMLLRKERRPATPSALTPTEIEVLRLIAKGLSVKEIAAERISSTHTVITHKKNIFRKLEVNNVYEATKYALRAGLVEMADYYI